jgi:hypothetical protein
MIATVSVVRWRNHVKNKKLNKKLAGSVRAELNKKLAYRFGWKVWSRIIIHNHLYLNPLRHKFGESSARSRHPFLSLSHKCFFKMIIAHK